MHWHKRILCCFLNAIAAVTSCQLLDNVVALRLMLVTHEQLICSVAWQRIVSCLPTVRKQPFAIRTKPSSFVDVVAAVIGWTGKRIATENLFVCISLLYTHRAITSRPCWTLLLNNITASGFWSQKKKQDIIMFLTHFLIMNGIWTTPGDYQPCQSTHSGHIVYQAFFYSWRRNGR